MIRKAQIKFIAITLSIVFAVLATIFLVSCIIMDNFNSKSLNIQLSSSVKDFESDKPIRLNSFIIKVERIDDQYVYKCYYDENKFNQTQLDKFYSNAKEDFNLPEQQYISGDIVYSTFNTIGGGYIIAGADFENEFNTLSNNKLNVLAFSSIIFVILGVVTWGLSYKVFDPLRKTLSDQRRFISDASHELKTPLSIISASADILENNTSKNIYENNEKWVESIKTQTERMSGLITDMLTLSKLDEGNNVGDIESFSLSNEIIGDALSFEALAYEKGKLINLDVDKNIDYTGDKTAIKKIANILLDNAIKHAMAGSNITVSLKKKNNKIIFYVLNNGCKIEEKEAQKIFERFYRGDQSRARENTTSGSGLGLSIAKGLADSNKWKIYAECKYDEFMKIILVL